jgi:hypothetical protein
MSKEAVFLVQHGSAQARTTQVNVEAEFMS